MTTEQGINERLFRSMPEVATAASTHRPELHPLGLAVSRYWFLCPIIRGEAGAPLRALDTTNFVLRLEDERVS